MAPRGTGPRRLAYFIEFSASALSRSHFEGHDRRVRFAPCAAFGQSILANRVAVLAHHLDFGEASVADQLEIFVAQRSAGDAAAVEIDVLPQLRRQLAREHQIADRETATRLEHAQRFAEDL